jgi:hypothetical protein
MKRKLEPGTLAIAVAKSGNEKIGESSTTYVEQRSCPDSCVFFDGGGCYAEDGPVGKFVTQPLNRAAALFANATPEEIAEAEADAIDRMEVMPDRPLRLHTVGDCKTDEAARIVAAAAVRYVERGGGSVWTYTHAWREVDRESWGSVHVLASCETPEDVRDAHARGYASSIVVEEFSSDRRYSWLMKRTAVGVGLPVHVDMVPCPAQTREGVSCSSCRLCMDSGRLLAEGITIGFAIHGTPGLQRKARLALNDPYNPTRKKSSRELIPGVVAELQEKLGREPYNREIAEVLGILESSVWQMRKSMRTGLPGRTHRRKRG